MPRLISTTLTFDSIEQATVTAALIHWRTLPSRPAELEYLAGNCGEFALLDTAQLDELIGKVADGDCA